jgi:uncharacterized protein (TIGR02145 family)
VKHINLFLLTLYILATAGMILLQTGCGKENQAPTCTVTDPENGREIPHGTRVIISVDADDRDGVIHGVNFYVDNSSIGISNRAPYDYEWNTLSYEIGTHAIKATASDNSGNSVSNEISVSLTEGVPQAEFSVYQTSVCPDSSARFYNRSINNPVTWLWNFGDGVTAASPNPSHSYGTVGRYTVSLTVTNGYGSDTETKRDYITVPNPVTDYDGHVYQTVQVGNQLWMKENLRSTHYADGTALIDGSGAGDISGDYTTKYYFAYNDLESYIPVYGRLYTWAAVMNGASGSESTPRMVQGVCPDGWHVPDDDEWQELEMYLGLTEYVARSTGWRGNKEGLMLRESGSGHWTDIYRDYISGTNESGFTAIPGGSRWYDESFRHLEERANFWSATETISSFAWARRLYYNHTEIYRYDDYKSRAYSVRCIKD